jgi:hypothetical protein
MERTGEKSGIAPAKAVFGGALCGKRESMFKTAAAILLSLSILILAAFPLYGRPKKTRKQDYGLGFSTEIAVPENDVLQAVDEVIHDSVIEGSQEYTREKEIGNADVATSSPLFPQWTAPGKVFYKVREKVLAPTNFLESNDEGTLAVRYVVQSKTPQKTILRIDAVFVEDFRRFVHPSNGSVESAEYKDVQDHVDAIELDKKQAADAEKHRQELLAKKALERKQAEEQAAALAAVMNSPQGLAQQVQTLRHQLERIVKAPGAELKSAPFHTATKLKTLDAGTEVVILVVSTYWYGVETEDGQHGWINHAQLEPLP